MKKVFNVLVFMFLVFGVAGCSVKNFSPMSQPDYYFAEGDNEEYLEINENPFIDTSIEPDSYFRLDTSTAGYANLRRLINQGAFVPKNAVKLEEMVNYFNYDYPEPANGDLGISAEMMDSPWSNNKIVSIGIKARSIEDMSSIPNNIVFLLDVSGSMYSETKLPLMQAAFKLLTENLTKNDIVSIVTYAGSDKVLLEGVNGSEQLKIRNVIEDLSAGGSTAGSKGIQTAYKLAAKYFLENGNNRVILATDGDFNVGISGTNELEKFIAEKRKSNIYLSVLGFGYGNLKDNKLETLAKAGDGNYAYIDSILEARKVLIEEFGGTLNIVAKDAKAHVSFNPEVVKEYRLLGYENKLLTQEEFENEETDSGDIGAGHTTTAVYEIVLHENANLNKNFLDVYLNYKDPKTAESKTIDYKVTKVNQKPSPSEDLLFISGVIEMGLILRESEHKGSASFIKIKQRLKDLSICKSDPYKAEFLTLLDKLIK